MIELNSRTTSIDGIGLVEVRLGWLPRAENSGEITLVQLYDEDEMLIGQAKVLPAKASDAFDHPMVYIVAA
jgi:hypothetical protein